MEFERSIYIQRSPQDVFAFFRNKDQAPQAADSPVLVLEKTSPGPVGVGTRYREVVQMFPLVKGEILSEVQRYEPPFFLEETFSGAGTQGYLAYAFTAEGQGTRLVQTETLHFKGIMSVFAPALERMLLKRIEARLAGIKVYLESGGQVGSLQD
jgi:hypothetical protein